MKFLKTCFLLFAMTWAFLLMGKENPPPLFSVGGGYYDAGPNHSGGLFQFEYRFGKYYFCYIRPQAIVILPEMHSVFLGIGLGLDLYLSKHLIATPSFSPGLYFQGKGRNLGYPLEFRSSAELSYEWNNRARLGCQFYHISNASLSDRNPGANALTIVFAYPLFN